VFFVSLSELVYVTDGVVLSKTVPAGSYVAEARLHALQFSDVNNNVQCTLPGSAGYTQLRPASDTGRDQDISITSAFEHAGGSVELRCTAESRIEVAAATLLLTTVDSVG
jgi:hypothetical protein